MDQDRDQRKGVVTFEREKPKTDHERNEAQPTKKGESVGRGVIAWILIVVLIVPVFGSLVSGAGVTGAGLFLWLVCFGLIALVAKWARWY